MTNAVTTAINEHLIGRTRKGERVYASIRIMHHGPEFTTDGDPIGYITTDHKLVTEYDTLSIMGCMVPPRCTNATKWGQIVDMIDDLDPRHKDTIAPSRLAILKDLWTNWHGNDMNAACIHQDEGSHVVEGTLQWHDKAVWDEQTDKCPHGYAYGSRWLIKVIPDDVLQQARELADFLSCQNMYRGQ